MYYEQGGGGQLAVYDGPAVQVYRRSSLSQIQPTVVENPLHDIDTYGNEEYDRELRFHVEGTRNDYWKHDKDAVPDDLKDIYDKWREFTEHDMRLTTGHHALDDWQRPPELRLGNRPKELEAAPVHSNDVTTTRTVESASPEWAQTTPEKPRRMRKFFLAIGAVAAALSLRPRR